MHDGLAQVVPDQRRAPTIAGAAFISRPGDPFEREAERVAAAVMRCATPGSLDVAGHGTPLPISRVVASQDSLMPSTYPATAAAIAAMRGPAWPLDTEFRQALEAPFGHDFSAVRLHTDSHSGGAARAIHAKAYTIGSHIAFAPGYYAPTTSAGLHILAHELTHTVQQRGVPPGIQRQPDNDGGWPPRMYTGGGGEFGGGGSTDSWEEPEAQPERPPCIGHGCHDYLDRGPDFRLPRQAPLIPSPARRLDFFHGTKWSVAQRIPGNVKPVGGGDFGAGFYTHFDDDASKALKRAVKWGQVIAKAPPAEAYVGVIRFDVDTNDLTAITTRGKGKTFGLRDPRHPDYAARQKAWIDFITAGGREAQPTSRQRKGRDEWVHKRRNPQPDLGYNVIAGPFYQPIPGKKSRKPSPSEFTPYQEGSKFPQQEMWAHDGIKLLNSSKVKTELMQFEAKTGKRQDPPVQYSVAATASQDTAALEEEAQFTMATTTLATP